LQDAEDALEGFDLVSRFQAVESTLEFAKWLPSPDPSDPSALHLLIAAVGNNGNLYFFDNGGNLRQSHATGHEAPITGGLHTSTSPLSTSIIYLHLTLIRPRHTRA
jgi:hypothetical protein